MFLKISAKLRHDRTEIYNYNASTLQRKSTQNNYCNASTLEHFVTMSAQLRLWKTQSYTTLTLQYLAKRTNHITLRCEDFRSTNVNFEQICDCVAERQDLEI